MESRGTGQESEVRILTVGCSRLKSPTKGNHVLCFEAIIIFFNWDFGGKKKTNPTELPGYFKLVGI